jgi:hypothetical protein
MNEAVYRRWFDDDVSRADAQAALDTSDECVVVALYTAHQFVIQTEEALARANKRVEELEAMLALSRPLQQKSTGQSCRTCRHGEYTAPVGQFAPIWCEVKCDHWPTDHCCELWEAK